MEVQLYYFFNIGARWGWVVNATPRPLYPRERDPVKIVLDARWAPGPVWTNEKNLAPTGTFFFISFCILYFIRTCFFVLIVLHFAFFVFTCNTQHKHPCPRWDSNPQPQHVIDRRPSPETAQPLGSAIRSRTVHSVASRYTNWAITVPTRMVYT
jgi:hypothetical protein